MEQQISEQAIIITNPMWIKIILGVLGFLVAYLIFSVKANHQRILRTIEYTRLELKSTDFAIAKHFKNGYMDVKDAELQRLIKESEFINKAPRSHKFFERIF